MKTKILIILIITTLFLFNSVEAAETTVFYDNFEGNLENWDSREGWSVVSENGNKVLQGTQHSFATAFLEGAVNKLELKLKLIKGSIHLNVRSKFVTGDALGGGGGQNRYFIGLNPGDSRISKEVGNNFLTLQGGGKGISFGVWHKIKIEIVGKRINVYSDGKLIIWAEDENILEEGGISIETFEDSIAYIDDVKVEALVPEARELKAKDLFPNGEHKGDLTITGRDFLILENGKFTQFGNIFLKDGAKLIIKNSELKISRYERLLNHWGIELEYQASLEIENSKIIPEGPTTLVVVKARDRARIKMLNSPTQIHLFIVDDSAKALVENSEIIGEFGGLIIASGRGEAKIVNSKIGAVNLFIPEKATFEAEGLRTGFFEDWNLQRDTKVENIDYNIILQNTEIIPDRIGPGPFERGWPVFIDSRAKVKIKNSELRKVVINLFDEKAEFSNFALGKPTNFNYRDILLENVIVKGQWGIFPHGSSDVTIRDSEAFWTFIYDDSKLKLINTHMNEFDPRNFRGEMVFENVIWDTAAEIIENNDFTIKGSLEIGNIGGFSWENSKVTRIYDVIGKPETKLTLTKDNEIVWSEIMDKEGRASFSLKFDDTTFNDSWILKDNLDHTQEVTFFSKTPIDMEQGLISKFISKIKNKMSSGPPPPTFKLVFPLILILLFVILFFYLKKKRRQKMN
ncbi:MAG: hypothetical protein WC610_03145 [Patescibacteria group bacterium]